MAAREDDTASNRNAEEEDYSPEAADQKPDETVAGAAVAAEVDECSDDDDDDPVIRNLNVMSRLNLMPPEWIENRRKLHYEQIDLFNRSHDALDALENGDIEPDDEAAMAECEEWSKRLWESVDLSGLNTVGGESCGVDAVPVYPVGVCPPEEEDNDAAAESSS
ncbi:unnamed protein product [Alopecurus aequalis]